MPPICCNAAAAVAPGNPVSCSVRSRKIRAGFVAEKQQTAAAASDDPGFADRVKCSAVCAKNSRAPVVNNLKTDSRGGQIARSLPRFKNNTAP